MAKPGDVARGEGWTLYCGDYLDALRGVDDIDAVITDPPYSERTHRGHDSLEAYDASGAPRSNVTRQPNVLPPLRRGLGYAPWAAADVERFAERFGAVPGWIVALTDHALVADYESALAPRYVFAPLACVEPGSRVRLAGDGPCQWSCLAVPSRPRSMRRWGALPGAYVVPRGYSDVYRRAVVGGKPLWLMRALVRDYSRRGDLVCDPCAGGGTTAVAALQEGRRFVGCELDPATFELAVNRLQRGYTPAFDFGR